MEPNEDKSGFEVDFDGSNAAGFFSPSDCLDGFVRHDA
jgi:hypothetical protein